LNEPLPIRVLIDEAVKTTRTHFKAMFLPAAVPLALLNGLVPLVQGAWMGALAGEKFPGMAALLGGIAALFIVLGLTLVLTALAYGALTLTAVDAVTGREISMKRSWLRMLRPRMIGTVLLSGMAAALAAVCCLLPGIYVGLLFCLVLPVMAHEDLFGTRAMGRSSQLVRHNPQRRFASSPMLKAFLVLLVGWLIGTAVGLFVGLPVAVIQQVLMWRSVAAGETPDPVALVQKMTWIQVPANILASLANTAVAVYMAFGLTLLYFDLRGRREADDLEAAIEDLAGPRQGAPSE
jgi:hypothetical protein